MGMKYRQLQQFLLQTVAHQHCLKSKQRKFLQVSSAKELQSFKRENFIVSLLSKNCAFLLCNSTICFKVALELRNATRADVRAHITFRCTAPNAFFSPKKQHKECPNKSNSKLNPCSRTLYANLKQIF